jgi:hypothetical protein
VSVATPGSPLIGVMLVIEYEFASMKCGAPSFGTEKVTVSVPAGPVKSKNFSAASAPSTQTVSCMLCVPSGNVE